MKAESTIVSIIFIALVSVLAIGTATSYSASPSPTPSQSSRHSQVHKVGRQIMNFDLTKSKHIFTSTVTGGKLTVLAKIKNTTLIRDIQAIHIWIAAELYDHGADATTANSMDSMITTKAMWARHHRGVATPSYIKK